MAIYHRDGFKCMRCDSPENLTLDHAFDDSHTPENLITLCNSCNAKRGDQRLSGFDPALFVKAIAMTKIPIDRKEGIRLAKERWPKRYEKERLRSEAIKQARQKKKSPSNSSSSR